ncbi:MAG TPA: ribonuclease PH [Alphaproteobacteria bacterium]|nr:ribonuclease PH [Alphaproteobacteria bacterium]
MRTDRKNNQLRDISIDINVNMHAEGSCLISMGNTQVLCTATVEKKVPPFLRNQSVGWITAEYNMLPRATGTRNQREVNKGKPSGRTMEIQRLIGRSLRAIIDTKKIDGYTITIDCDVIQADGGTRTTSITGAYVALKLAINKMLETGLIKRDPLTDQLAAISVGISKDDEVILDLDYLEDSSAVADGNFVMTKSGKIIEVQTTAEEYPITDEQFLEMMKVAKTSIIELCEKQDAAIN